jgi:AraC family transcriptional regulator
MMSGGSGTQTVRRRMFEGELMCVGHVAVRPASSDCGEIERQSCNILVLPLAGVFAKHDGPRRHVIATSNHAVFLCAGEPYRLSFPGSIGDRCLTLQMSGAALAQLLPQAASSDGFDTAAFASHALLPADTMLARSRLWQRLARGGADPLDVEEAGLGLLVSALRAARKGRSGRRPGAARDRGHRLRRVEAVKEAIAMHPAGKWTLGGLGELACMSPYHLAHVFRAEVGASVYQYVLRSRLAVALDAVLVSDADLTTVALDAGFASHSHFTASFRSFFGATPTELRRGTRASRARELRGIAAARPTASA